jgi:hypothetical protein
MNRRTKWMSNNQSIEIKLLDDEEEISHFIRKVSFLNNGYPTGSNNIGIR